MGRDPCSWWVATLVPDESWPWFWTGCDPCSRWVMTLVLNGSRPLFWLGRDPCSSWVTTLVLNGPRPPCSEWVTTLVPNGSRPLFRMGRDPCSEWVTTLVLNGSWPLFWMGCDPCSGWVTTLVLNGSRPLFWMVRDPFSEWVAECAVFLQQLFFSFFFMLNYVFKKGYAEIVYFCLLARFWEINVLDVNCMHCKGGSWLNDHEKIRVPRLDQWRISGNNTINMAFTKLWSALKNNIFLCSVVKTAWNWSL